MRTVTVATLAPERLEALIGPERGQRFRETAAAAHGFLAGRRVLNVNSTATGGGVAELLQTLLAYARGVGIDTEWLVIDGHPAFFEVTKRVHNHLYGVAGDGGPLGDDERAVYEATLAENSNELLAVVQPRDIVVLHDPQTAGLVPRVRAAGAVAVWRCHIGCDRPNPHTELGWDFLRRYLGEAEAYVFTRAAFVPRWMDQRRAHVIPPSIDPFSAKNQELDRATTRSILQYTGLLAGAGDPPTVSFSHRDGSPGRVDRRADILQTGPPPPPDAPLVVQVSRWDRLKDMRGVLEGFVEHVTTPREAHLALVGPAVHGVTDDPESGAVLDDCIERWRALPHAARSRVHLACIPMHDPDENAIITNALQRHAAVVVQKSFAEGFGLTITEAMWKRRPVVASRVGGLAEQLTDGRDALLVEDPTDLRAFGRAVQTLLDDPALARRLGDAAHQRASDEYLADRHLERYASLFATLAHR